MKKWPKNGIFFDSCFYQSIREYNAKNKPSNQDSKNREEVIERVKQYMKKGMTQEEAVDILMQDETVMNQFAYLKKNGLDVKQCFMNWTKCVKDKTEKFSNKDGVEK